MMNDNHALGAFREKFKIEELLILKSGSWSWSIRPDQPTLGASILSLNRHAPRFSDVTSAEMAELADLISILEKRVKVAFNHSIMNYLMLMMVDHHVHFHVLPRYESVRSFGGLDWVDNGWPALPVMGDSQHKGQNDALKLIQAELVRVGQA